MMRRKTILVTGGAGRLGSRFCEQFLQEEHNVVCIDNLCTSSKKSILHLMDNPRFEFIRKNITDPYSIEADEIYHLAYPEDIEFRYTHAIEVTKTAFMGTLNTLEIAKRKKCKFFYPKLPMIPCDEIKKDARLERYYTDRKTMEYLIQEFAEKFGVKAEAIEAKYK